MIGQQNMEFNKKSKFALNFSFPFLTPFDNNGIFIGNKCTKDYNYQNIPSTVSPGRAKSDAISGSNLIPPLSLT